MKEVRQLFQHDPALREVALFERGNWKETSRLRKALGLLTFEEAQPHKPAARQVAEWTKWENDRAKR